MRVDLQAGQRTAVVIAEAALMPLGSNNFVFVLEQNGTGSRVMRRPIVIGERLPGAVEVLEGIVAGEKLVTHGLQKIRDEQPVAVMAEEQPINLHSKTQEHLTDLLQQAKP
jgi:membrane fusion protein, multidrug efflux system